MAYILEIIEWIIVTKTNPKPIENQMKSNGGVDNKVYQFEVDMGSSKSFKIQKMARRNWKMKDVYSRLY